MIKDQRGDTLIEVLVATVVLSVVTVSAFILMNRGMATTMQAVENTQVRQVMDGQLDMVRYIHNAALGSESTSVPAQQAAEWANLLAKTNPTTITAFNACPNNVDAKRFYITTAATEPKIRVAQYTATTRPAGQAIAGDGIWLEAVRPNAGANYIDVHVRACWNPIIGTTNQTLSTVTRLYVN